MITVTYSITCDSASTARSVSKQMLKMDDLLLIDGVSIINLTWFLEEDEGSTDEG
ncbi:MAG: hypothetical protein ABWY25_07485 [Paenisporosarcina sp.]